MHAETAPDGEDKELYALEQQGGNGPTISAMRLGQITLDGAEDEY